VTHQPTLFDDDRPAKIARDSDPDTSHAAADEMLPKLGKLESRLLSAFRRWPKTAREAADDAARLFNCLEGDGKHTETESYRKRYTGLLKRGRIIADGVKTCRVSGKTVTAYKLKDEQK